MYTQFKARKYMHEKALVRLFTKVNITNIILHNFSNKEIT